MRKGPYRRSGTSRRWTSPSPKNGRRTRRASPQCARRRAGPCRSTSTARMWPRKPCCRRSTPPIPAKCWPKYARRAGKRSTAPLPGPRPPSPRGATPRRWNARSTCTRPLPWPGGVSTKWRRSRRWRSASLGNRLTATWARASTSSNTTPATCSASACPGAWAARPASTTSCSTTPRALPPSLRRGTSPSPLRWAWFRPQSSPGTRWCSSLRPCPRPSATILWKSSRKWGSPLGSSTIAPVRAPSWATIWWNTRTSASSALPVRWTWACTSWKRRPRCSRASGRSSGSSRKWAARTPPSWTTMPTLTKPCRRSCIRPSVFRGRSARPARA